MSSGVLAEDRRNVESGAWAGVEEFAVKRSHKIAIGLVRCFGRSVPAKIRRPAVYGCLGDKLSVRRPNAFRERPVADLVAHVLRLGRFPKVRDAVVVFSSVDVVHSTKRALACLQPERHSVSEQPYLPACQSNMKHPVAVLVQMPNRTDVPRTPVVRAVRGDEVMVRTATPAHNSLFRVVRKALA